MYIVQLATYIKMATQCHISSMYRVYQFIDFHMCANKYLVHIMC